MAQTYLADLSHWNPVTDWDKYPYKAVILKCTEGTAYKDPTYEKNKKEARRRGILVGSYHFSKGGDAKKEARWFYNSIWDWDTGEFLVLDFEIHILNPVAWCLTFLKELERLCGFKPFIYLSHGFIKSWNWTPIANNNNGLWAARYGLNLGYEMTAFKPNTGSWSNYAMWQYTSRGRVAGIKGNVDLNVFQGSINQLRKYGRK